MSFFKSKINTAIVILFFGVGFLGGSFWMSKNDKKNQQEVLSQIHSIREKDNNYSFINPLLAYDLPESKDFWEYIDLKQKLDILVNSKKNQHLADDISVYFRGTQGHWVGINDSEKFYPASLLKVVIMIAYYQQAQKDPSILNKMLTYTDSIQKQFLTSEYDAPSSLKLNQGYKVDDLIHEMIVNSDNGATFTLIDSLSSKDLDEIYTDFGLQRPGDSLYYGISAKDYSLFFRILYNATYLNRQYSNEALSLLSQASYKNGLVAGLPQGTRVAHKFGEYVIPDSNGFQIGVELHDCGYVYAKKMFLLCVMTRGEKLEDLEKTIKDITNLVYSEAEK